jgi:hypothetical protein
MIEAYDFVQTFDPERRIQYVNDDPSVMHCHHYATLFTKLAFDFEDIGALNMLRDSVEEAYYIVLKKAIILREAADIMTRINLIEEHHRLAGLGKLELIVNGVGGSAKLYHSHMDEGWLRKWGSSDVPVNIIGQGFLAAAFDLLFDKKPRSFVVKETQSLVAGSPYSHFEITEAKED